MRRLSKFSPGDIVLANLDPATGHEQKGKRPVIVISHLHRFGLIIVVPLTTKDKGWWTQVRISKDESRLPEDSFALCHQIRSLSVERVDTFTGRISPLSLGKIKTVLGRVLGL